MTDTEDKLLARLRVGGARRVVAILAVTLLGGAVLYLAAAEGMDIGWRAFLIGLGAIMLWGAWAIQKATETDLLLKRSGLYDASGRMIAEMDNIDAVDRGVFAVKPPSGFVIRLKKRMKSGWAPGVWWRVGRKIGIGGAVSGLETKAVAEILELALADRAGTLKRD